MTTDGAVGWESAFCCLSSHLSFPHLAWSTALTSPTNPFRPRRHRLPHNHGTPIDPRRPPFPQSADRLDRERQSLIESLERDLADSRRRHHQEVLELKLALEAREEDARAAAREAEGLRARVERAGEELKEAEVRGGVGMRLRWRVGMSAVAGVQMRTCSNCIVALIKHHIVHLPPAAVAGRHAPGAVRDAAGLAGERRAGGAAVRGSVGGAARGGSGGGGPGEGGGAGQGPAQGGGGGAGPAARAGGGGEEEEWDGM